jgi:hypothetical protein
MFKVQYDHPPRQWDFYAGFILRLALILSPVILLFGIWFSVLPLPINLGFALFLAIVCTFSDWHTIRENYVLNYDALLKKGNDISYQMTFPPQSIEEGIGIAESLGFTRLGEEAAFVGLQQQAIITFYMTNTSEDISFEIIEFEHIKPYFARFVTWFKGDCLVETYYPVGDSVNYPDYRVEGINTSLEAAYHYHLRQIAEFEQQYGSPVKLDSLQTIMDYEGVYRQKHRPRLHAHPNFRNFAKWLSLSLMFSAGFYWFVAYLYALSNSTAPLSLLNLDRSVSLICFGLGLAILGFVRMPSRSIQQVKKKHN